MNGDYFVALAKTFEDRFGVKFVGIEDGPVTDERERLIQYKTNLDVLMSTLNKNALGDWIADRLVKIGDEVKDDMSVNIDNESDPFLDQRLQPENLPDSKVTVSVEHPTNGSEKEVDITLFEEVGQKKGTRNRHRAREPISFFGPEQTCGSLGYKWDLWRIYTAHVPTRKGLEPTESR